MRPRALPSCLTPVRLAATLLLTLMPLQNAPLCLRARLKTPLHAARWALRPWTAQSRLSTLCFGSVPCVPSGHILLREASKATAAPSFKTCSACRAQYLQDAANCPARYPRFPRCALSAILLLPWASIQHPSAPMFLLMQQACTGPLLSRAALPAQQRQFPTPPSRTPTFPSAACTMTAFLL